MVEAPVRDISGLVVVGGCKWNAGGVGTRCWMGGAMEWCHTWRPQVVNRAVATRPSPLPIRNALPHLGHGLVDALHADPRLEALDPQAALQLVDLDVELGGHGHAPPELPLHAGVVVHWALRS